VASPLFAAREFSVSSDTSPPSGYRLENPARTAGAAGGATATRQIPAAPAPSWRSVIGTTLRLWVRRRVLRVPDTGRIGRGRAAGAAAVVVVVVAAVAVAVVLALTGAPASTAARKHAVTAPKLTPAQQAAQAQAAANGTAAATWVAAQVGQQVVIGCDPATCAAILTAGYASGGQVVLQPGVSLPAAGALIVATPAVRAQYGAALDNAAPGVIAAFGTGAQAVQVRLVSTGGQAAYSQAASSAIAARAKAGRALLANRKVHVHLIARKDLTAGLVDPRLLTVLHRLAAHDALDINWFGDAGPLADGSVPFRLAEIINLSGKHATHQTSQLAAVEKLLQHQPSGYRAALTAVRLPGGKYGLKIEFPAPSPQ
jgi:hypothetical protein